MASNKKAESIQEFFDKYKRKRYNPENAALCIILEYLYQYYLENFNGAAPQDHLYSSDRKRTILQMPYEADSDFGKMLVVGMQNLIYWLVSVHDLAFATRESARLALDSACEDVYRIMRNDLYESLKGTMRELANYIAQKEITSAVDKSFKEFAEVADESKTHFKDNLRFAKNELCFVYAYNTLIPMIASALKIPELEVFTINTDAMEESINALNQALLQYDGVASAEDDLDTTEITYPPELIPESNLKNAATRINMAMYQGYNWHEALRAIDSGYWWRVLDGN